MYNKKESSKGKACKIKTRRRLKGELNLKEEEAPTTSGTQQKQQWTTTNTTVQAGAEPGRIQEALAGFAKGA